MSIEEKTKYVIFRLNDEYYGIPINSVLSIERIGKATRIPNAPDYVNGVINLRGEIIPIISLKTKLGMGNGDIGENSRIVIAAEGEKVVGIIVDSSSEVLEIDNNNIDKPPVIDDNQYIEFVNGIGKVSERLIILLNLNRILQN